jgi:glycosyltransferase involved in cell wall biosynthesis
MTLLTIAVPTFERVGYLKELLPKMIEQCKSFHEVEILIRDNDSHDGTWSYIRDLERNNDNVRAEMNLTNVGGDENFVRCVEEAQGEYIWLFGDDELICEDSVEMIVVILKEFKPSLLMVCGDKSQKTIIRVTKYRDFIRSSNPQDIINQTLITGNIFKKSIFDTGVARRRSPNLNGSYSHIYAIADYLKHNNGCIIRTRDPLFATRSSRAPFKQHLRFIRLKWLNLLLYLGVPLNKIAKFAIVDLAFSSAMRQVHKLGGAP